MKMQENMLRLNIKRKIAIVLDASDSAEGHWSEIRDCVENLVNNLSGDVEREIYFLGNSHAYKGNILAFANKWREDNKNRGSFIAPILKKIDKDTEMVVVIGSGRIFDLQDYVDTSFADKIILVSIGESLKGDENIRKEISASEINDMYDPIVEVVIKGECFMPYYWDNQNYKFELSDEGAILRGSKLNAFSVSIHGFGDGIKGYCKTMNGQEMKFDLDVYDVSKSIEEKQQNLSKKDEMLFREIVKNKNKKYICPICEEEHDYRKIKCKDDKDEHSILFDDKCIYGSLKSFKGFIIFNENESNILYRNHPLSVLKLSENEVAVALTSSEIRIFKFKDRKWVNEDNFENYYKTLEGKWIIYL